MSAGSMSKPGLVAQAWRFYLVHGKVAPLSVLDSIRKLNGRCWMLEDQCCAHECSLIAWIPNSQHERCSFPVRQCPPSKPNLTKAVWGCAGIWCKALALPSLAPSYGGTRCARQLRPCHACMTIFTQHQRQITHQHVIWQNGTEHTSQAQSTSTYEWGLPAPCWVRRVLKKATRKAKPCCRFP